MTRLAYLPPPEAFAHGTRARYVTGCRCQPCRGANAARSRARFAAIAAAASSVKPSGPPIESELVRAGVVYKVKRCPGANGRPCVVAGATWLRDGGPVCRRCVEREAVFDGLVSAERARAHLRELSKRHVGRRSVAAACDIPQATLVKIKKGTKKTIRASTEKRILAVDVGAVADSASVPAKKSWRLIRKMLRAGHTRRELARRLGSAASNPALQMSRRFVWASTALKVEKLFREVSAEIALEKAMPKVECNDCGYSHKPAARLELLERHHRRGAELEPLNVLETWPCMYGDGDTGYRRLMRDLAKLRERTAATASEAA